MNRKKGDTRIDPLEIGLSLSICGFCRHKTAGAPTCTAYPEGIPAPFLSGDAYHTTPTTGDNGIQYEANPNRPLPDYLADKPKTDG